MPLDFGAVQPAPGLYGSPGRPTVSVLAARSPRTIPEVGKFVAYLLFLAALAVGAAWYSLRAGIVPASVSPSRKTAAEDTSWLADLYSQNPRDTEKGTAKVGELGVRALPRIQATLRDPGSEHNHRRAALRACAILGVAAEPVIPEVAAALSERDLAVETLSNFTRK